MSMHCSDKLPVAFPEVWSFIRDHAKATTPLAEWALREARTYCEPSKAHRRRLLRHRPQFTKPPILPPVDATPRCRFNSARSLGMEAAEMARNAALVERHYIAGNAPLVDRGVNLTPPKPKVTVPPVDRWPTLEEIERNIAALER